MPYSITWRRFIDHILYNLKPDIIQHSSHRSYASRKVHMRSDRIVPMNTLPLFSFNLRLDLFYSLIQTIGGQAHDGIPSR
jgi:hypothetical protein